MSRRITYLSSDLEKVDCARIPARIKLEEMALLFGIRKPKTPNLNKCIADIDSRMEAVEKKTQHIDKKLERLMSKMRDDPSQNNIKQKASRLLSQKKEYESKALNKCIADIDSRMESVEKKTHHIDEKLKGLMSKMRDDPTQNDVKQKALRLLSQKKEYEIQADNLLNKSFDLAVNSAIQTLEETAFNEPKWGVKAKKSSKMSKVNKLNSEVMLDEFQTDDSGAGRQFWANLMISWHTKKKGSYNMQPKPTKTS